MTQISMFLEQYLWTYGNFHFLPAKRPKMVFQLFLTNASSMTKSNRYKSTTISRGFTTLGQIQILVLNHIRASLGLADIVT